MARPARKTKVVAASLAAGGSERGAGGLTGRAIEEAMAAATNAALEAGITDPDEIRELKLAARERVKSEARAASEKAAEAAAKG